ncbi:unnamed protein product, partial [Phaeothamnion confervicola]
LSSALEQSRVAAALAEERQEASEAAGEAAAAEYRSRTVALQGACEEMTSKLAAERRAATDLRQRLHRHDLDAAELVALRRRNTELEAELRRAGGEPVRAEADALAAELKRRADEVAALRERGEVLERELRDSYAREGERAEEVRAELADNAELRRLVEALQ